MALIKCPRCGQTVLSVASTCPKCSYLFLQDPKEESAAGALVDCRRCSKRIPPESAACPYCGYPIRRIGVLVRAGIGVAVAAVALLALLLALGRRRGPEPIVASVAGTDVRAAVEEPVELPAASPAADSVRTDTSLRPSPLAAAPRTFPPPAQVAERQQPTPARQQPPPAAGARDTRWSLDWVNVREGRGVGSAIVTVLRPGVQVQVADQRGGWWAVYVDGSFVGYASGALFGSEPPSDTAT